MNWPTRSPWRRPITTSASECENLMKAEERINPRLSREVIELLVKRGWTRARITMVSRATRPFIDQVAAGERSFSPVQARHLAKAVGVPPVRLFFDAMEPAAL